MTSPPPPPPPIERWSRQEPPLRKGTVGVSGACIGRVVRSLGASMLAPHMYAKRTAESFKGLKDVDAGKKIVEVDVGLDTKTTRAPQNCKERLGKRTYILRMWGRAGR